MKARLLLAFLVVASTWTFHKRSSEMTTPRYFPVLVIVRSWPWIWYVASTGFLLLVTLTTSHLLGLNDICPSCSHFSMPVNLIQAYLLNFDEWCQKNDMTLPKPKPWSFSTKQTISKIMSNPPDINLNET